MSTWVVRVWSWPLWRLSAAFGVDGPIRRDAERYATCSGMHHLNSLDEWSRFAWVAARFPEFRSLVHARLKPHLPLVVQRSLRALWPGQPTLYIYCEDIGPGLFIQHGFATTITARSIGEDCWINQQVTIGWTAQGLPVLGDRVRIGAAAVVLGPIAVADDAVVGANATVVKSVAAGSVVVGPTATEVVARSSE